MTDSLAEVFTTEEVMSLAGPPAFARGAGYHRQARVEHPEVANGRLRAVVRGSVPYTVELWHVDGESAWSCTCPVGEEGLFCKHCVAVALTLDHAPDDLFLEDELVPVGGDGGVDLRAHLLGMGVDRLVDLVLKVADRDWRLHERLAAEASAAAGAGVDVGVWRHRIEVVFAADGDFVPYAEAEGWARDVDELIDALDELADAGHADAVAVLAEYAHRQADDAVGHVDDSDGCLAAISERIGELHLKACHLGAPEPVELAGRLVDLELTSELDAFHRAAVSHAGVLGPTGIAEYWRLIEPKWLALDPELDRWSGERFRVREAMIGVALATGDPDELIRVRQHDLRTPDDYREIAVALLAADRVDDAIDWARRGLEAFADRAWQTPPLRELLAGLLRDRHDIAGAIELFWAAFEAHPSVEAYRRLLSEVEGRESTDDWRHRAVTALRARVAERGDGDTPRSARGSTPASALIEILLYEGDVSGAWDVATEHGCDQRLWLTVARAREATHPLDPIAIYEREARAQIDTKKNPGYRSAVDYLSRIRRLSSAGGEPERFDRLLAAVRAEHKPKRNLMALLDGQGW